MIININPHYHKWSLWFAVSDKNLRHTLVASVSINIMIMLWWRSSSAELENLQLLQIICLLDTLNTCVMCSIKDQFDCNLILRFIYRPILPSSCWNKSCAQFPVPTWRHQLDGLTILIFNLDQISTNFCRIWSHFILNRRRWNNHLGDDFLVQVLLNLTTCLKLVISFSFITAR